MRLFLALFIFLLSVNFISAQVIENKKSYIISKKVTNRVFLEIGDYKNQLNQKEFFFQLILEEGFENKETIRHIIINCIGNKNRTLFDKDCKEVTKTMLDRGIVETTINGSFNNFLLTINNNFDVVKIENTNLKKSIVLNGDEYIMLSLILNREDINRGF